jgi:hypothetical protein
VSTPARFGWLTFAGLLLVQAAWILAVPPFRGIDEFDHVYRAAGVASGQWRLSEPALDGRGVVVEVPASLVEAASAQCESLPYTGRDNCVPISERAGERVTIATAAGLYPPHYYLLIGWPTRWLDGASADYALRLLSAMVCAVGLAVAAWALALGGTGTWTRFGFVTSLTPVLVYTTILPAPNSIEIVGALCLWTSLLTLADRGVADRTGIALLVVATIAGCLVGSLRTIGPMWLGLIVLTVVAFKGTKAITRVARTRLAHFGVATLVVAAAVVAGGWWNASVGMAAATPASETGDNALGATTWLSRAIVWTVQIVGAFPFRDQPAPTAVYALYFAIVVPFISAAVLAARGRMRVVLLLATAVTVLLPLTITVMTADSQGVIWQGRYILPFVVGVPILCGLALDARSSRVSMRVLLPPAVMVAVAHTWSVWDVAIDETQRITTHVGPDWITLPPPFLGLMTLLGWLVLLGGVTPRPAAAPVGAANNDRAAPR